MSDCGCEMEARNREERVTLVIVLIINAAMFVLELGFGVHAQSTGLISDSLDMFADASVYGVGLYAVGRSPLLKTRAATLSGISQVLLALGALVEVFRRSVFGSEPASQWMVAIGLVALVANVTCLALIQRHRRGDVNMRAMWICSKNDVLANVGVIATGGLVALTGSRYPDLVIGFAIAFLVGRGGLRILREAQTASYAKADGRTV